MPGRKPRHLVCLESLAKEPVIGIRVSVGKVMLYAIFFCIRIPVDNNTFKVIAAGKRRIANRSNTIRDGDLCKVFAAGKCKIVNRSNTVGYGNLRKVFAAGKCKIANRSNTVGDGNLRKVFATAKRLIANRSNPA